MRACQCPLVDFSQHRPTRLSLPCLVDGRIPTHAQHCVLPSPYIRPLRQRRHCNARSSRSSSEVCVRSRRSGALTRALAQTPMRQDAATASCSKIRWSKTPSCSTSYPTGQAGGVRPQKPKRGTPPKTKLQLLQPGTFFVDFPTASRPSQTIRRPPRLRLRVGFEYIAWEMRVSRGRVTGTCGLIRRLSSPVQGAISSFYLPPYASVMINLTVLPMDARNEGEEESIGVTW